MSGSGLVLWREEHRLHGRPAGAVLLPLDGTSHRNRELVASVPATIIADSHSTESGLPFDSATPKVTAKSQCIAQGNNDDH